MSATLEHKPVVVFCGECNTDFYHTDSMEDAKRYVAGQYCMIADDEVEEDEDWFILHVGCFNCHYQ